MAIKVINTVLVIVIVIGALFTYQASVWRRWLLAEQTRLEAKVGSLLISDPTKPHVRAVPTGDEMHFEWRVYVPPGMAFKWGQSVGGDSGESWHSSAVEFTARVRLRENEQGELGVFSFSKQQDDNCWVKLGDRELAELLRGREGQIQVEQLGLERDAVIEPDEVVTVLRLTLSDDMKQEAEKKLDSHVFSGGQRSLYTLQFGSTQAFRKARARGQTSDGP